jgi:hypothetical protein
MNFRLTLGLTIILVLIGSLVLFLQPWKEKPAPPSESTKDLVISPAPEQITKITYTRDGQVQETFEKSPDGWVMLPGRGKADTYQVDDIARDLKELHYREKFAPEPTGYKSAEATGTDKPKNVIDFEDDKGKKYTLSVGKRTIDGAYATLNGDPTIYTLQSNPLDHLDKDPQDFRDKTIQTVKDEDIAALTIKHGGDTVSLQKNDGKWLISAPISARASAATVQEILNEFRTIRATGFSDLLTKDSPATGLTPPLVTVTAMVRETPSTPATSPATAPAATQKSLQPITLELGYYVEPVDKKNVYASIADTKEVFKFDAKSFDKLNRELKDLRDPSITPAPVSQATEFSITTDGKTDLAATKKDDKWTLTTPATQPPLAGDTFAINGFLTALRDEKAIKYVDNAGDLKSIGLDPPHMKIELAVPGQSQREVVLVGKPETADKVTPMMRQGEPTVFLVQTAEAEKLQTSPLALRDKTIERLIPDQIREIEISGPAAAGGGVTLQRDGTAWVLKKGPASTPADEVKLTSFLADFTPISAAKYLEEKPDSAQPAATVKLTIVEPSMTPPATAPGAATAPAASQPAAFGPDPGKTVHRTLKLFKQEANNTTSWRAVWDGQQPTWTFQPTQALVDHIIKESFAAPAATQSATQPATAPANPG